VGVGAGVCVEGSTSRIEVVSVSESSIVMVSGTGSDLAALERVERVETGVDDGFRSDTISVFELVRLLEGFL
jgi:hypothetical protein